MIEYISQIPYFLFFVLLGVVVNYLYFIKKEELTTKRVAREFLGAIWVSLIVFSVFDQYFNVKILFIYMICSLTGFLNSMLITFLKKDLFEFLVEQGKQAVKNAVSNIKKNKYEDNYGGGWGGHHKETENLTEEEKNHPQID